MFRSFNSPVKISRRVSSISSLLFSNSTPLLPQYDLPVTVSPSPAVFFSIFSLRSPPRSVYCQTRFASVMAGNSSNTVSSVHEFTVKDARGNELDLSSYKGKVLLIVNVASQCGLTNKNYTELSQLYEKYKEKDFEILAFPCNQFGGQEPGTNEQIVEFACTCFKAEYPIFDKVDVNGDNTAPVYKFLKSSKRGLLGEGIKWNFEKFLVDKEGIVVDRYAPTTSPLSFEKSIKKLLGLA
ncbi:putative phospholipid hydroperoxide glutathione peroxidase 6,mitochondrial [Zostera marina]|uniref:Glutathione peroxidase n=1 Tax=Zostera marina TaxID=29655 RepID=A0A0K9PHD2_ZOSMR|nr:putative phospholipid hydroperoxide glutathione peroxidase 6,mitochondrial [Zostera marina]